MSIAGAQSAHLHISAVWWSLGLSLVDPRGEDKAADRTRPRESDGFTQQCRADIAVTCFAYEGIDAIRDALLAGCDAGTAECPIRIKLLETPIYVMTTMTLDKDLGIAALQAGIDAITAKIQVRGLGALGGVWRRIVSLSRKRANHPSGGQPKS